MTRVIDSPSAGTRGEGKVEIIDAKTARVNIVDKDKKQHDFTLVYDQGVNRVSIGDWPLQNVEDVYVQMTPELDDIEYIRPRNGVFYVEFSRFGADPGKLPTIRYYERGKPFPTAKWENPERYASFALYKILALGPYPDAGPYVGMEIMDMLTYEWEWDENLDEWLLVGSERKKWHEHVLASLDVFGFDLQHDNMGIGEMYDAGGPAEIPNILPELEDILQSRARLGVMELKNGWVQVDSIKRAQSGMTKEKLQRIISGDEGQME